MEYVCTMGNVENALILISQSQIFLKLLLKMWSTSTDKYVLEIVLSFVLHVTSSVCLILIRCLTGIAV
jgi:hypothetical protein